MDFREHMFYKVLYGIARQSCSQLEPWSWRSVKLQSRDEFKRFQFEKKQIGGEPNKFEVGSIEALENEGAIKYLFTWDITDQYLDGSSYAAQQNSHWVTQLFRVAQDLTTIYI